MAASDAAITRKRACLVRVCLRVTQLVMFPQQHSGRWPPEKREKWVFIIKKPVSGKSG